MHRFYCPGTSLKTKAVEISQRSELHHITNVLRLKTGATISLFNDSGEQALGVIEKITKQKVHISISKRSSDQSRNTVYITLACAIPKKAKFESIIEKATELGVDEIIPLETKRTEVKLTAEKRAKKALRYQTIAINASKQCQRSVMPIIHQPTPFKDALKFIDKGALALIPWLVGADRLTINDSLKKLKEKKKIFVFIGPEGDFTSEEIKQAKAAGCLPITLGQTILKVDTAAISVLSLLKFQLNHS